MSNTCFLYPVLPRQLEEEETGSHIESCQQGRYQPMAFLQEPRPADDGKAAKRRAA